jgi:DNA helicase II / ATP-dependent DNA helicase PcrA
MVTIDAPQTRGFSFDYEKLFGAKAETTNDARNRREGKETRNDRTRRLLYVTTSRAEKSLAIVFFTEHPTAIRESVIRSGWFDQSEVTVL